MLTNIKTVETKILKAITTNKLNLKVLVERMCYNYFICVTELEWGRNFHDGYLIEVYDEKYGDHFISKSLKIKLNNIIIF
jgi:hypothetical protein